MTYKILKTNIKRSEWVGEYFSKKKAVKRAEAEKEKYTGIVGVYFNNKKIT